MLKTHPSLIEITTTQTQTLHPPLTRWGPSPPAWRTFLATVLEPTLKRGHISHGHLKWGQENSRSSWDGYSGFLGKYNLILRGVSIILPIYINDNRLIDNRNTSLYQYSTFKEEKQVRQQRASALSHPANSFRGK